MNVGFMRIVDKWIGIPLCLVLSCFHRLIRPFLFFFTRKDKAVKRILFMQISEMGSAISAYSALMKTRELYPEAEIHYFIFREMQESVHLLNVLPAGRVITVTSKSLTGFVSGILKTIVTMRRLKFDVILDLELFSRLSSLLSYLFGARIRVGFHRFHMEGLYRGSFQSHRVMYNHLRHISHNFLSLVYAIGCDPGDIPLSKTAIPDGDVKICKIRPSDAEKRAMMQKLRGINPGINEKKTLIIFNPNASGLLPLRRWPMRNYIELAKMLVRDKSVYIVVTGVPSEIEDAVAICGAVGDAQCINFAGRTTLRELIGLYSISDLLLSNDSGPPNFASLTDIRGLVFFGPESPVCYKPLGKNIEALYADYLCSPCVSAYNHRKSACTDNKCLQAITAEEVYGKIKRILKLK